MWHVVKDYGEKNNGVESIDRMEIGVDALKKKANVVRSAQNIAGIPMWFHPVFITIGVAQSQAKKKQIRS